MTPLTKTLIRTAAILGFAATSQAQISFTGPNMTPTGQRVGGLVYADFNGDGHTDMAVATDGTGNLDLIEIYAGDSTGTFNLANTVFLANGSSPSSLAAADFDGDGVVDLAVSLKNFNQVQMVRNMGAFAFSPQSSTGAGGSEPRQVTAADMDGDGDMDVVVSLRDSSSIAVIRNTGGVFSLLGQSPAGDDVRDHAVGDFDGDGDMDVAAASHDDRTVRVLMNNGTGNLSMFATLSVPPTTRPSGLAAGDLNGDGTVDLVAASGDDTIVGQNFASIYMNMGGTFAPAINLPTGGLDANDVVIADFSVNGSMDLAVANQDSGTISMFANNGTGAFAAPTFVSASPAASDLATGDVDGNGSPDLGSTPRQASGVQTFLNTKGGAGLGTPYCTANANSTGQTARTRAFGSAVASANNLTLTCEGMPTGVFGFFLVGPSQGFITNPGGSQGNLCLAVSIGRLNQQIQMSDASGSISVPVDLTALPTPGAPVAAMAGQTWNFQCWHRDTVAGLPASNFSDGYSIAFQ